MAAPIEIDYSKLLLSVLSVLTGGGFAAYVGHSIWINYQKTVEDLYKKVDERRKSVDCTSFIETEEKAR